MSSFIIDLWESIFTPGPTPTILKATNVSFAALQILLLSLLFVTASIHFVVLSVLCVGLWWAINWFARELAAAQEAQRREASEKEEERDLKKTRLLGSGPAKGGSGNVGDSSDTEVETTARQSEARSLRRRAGKGDDADADADADENGVAALRGSQSQSSASTEDEWEKVSESEKEKGK